MNRVLFSRQINFVLAIFFCWLFSSCVTIVPVEFKRIENFRTNFDHGKPKITLDLVINNPNPYGITVTEVASDFFINNQSVSKISLPMKKHIVSSGETNVPIELNFTLNSLLALLPASVPTLLNKSIDTRLSGYIRVRKFIFKKRIPFSNSQKLAF